MTLRNRRPAVATAFYLFLCLMACTLFSCTAPGDSTGKVVVRDGDLVLQHDLSSGRFLLSVEDRGLILREGVLTLDGKEPVTAVPSEADPGGLEFIFGEEGRVSVRLKDNRLEAAVEEGGDHLVLHGETGWGRGAFNGFLQNEQQEDRGVLVTTLGPASVPGAGSLFDPAQDRAVAAEGDKGARWTFDGQSGWRLEASGRNVSLSVTDHYYRDQLGIEHYAPMEKRSFWMTAPVVAMTWYGVCGIKQPQELEVLKPEIDWVAEQLLPYAGRLVFQLDDKYDYHDDGKMRRLSDYIRSKGLIPGIWFTPYSVAPEAAYREHPEWFLHGGDGNRLISFGGVNWKWSGRGQSAGVLNMDQSGAVENWFAPFWRKVSETWNFDFFKIDGQPTAVEAYRSAADARGVESYRRGLSIGRDIVGPDKFINGCWGMAVEGAGIMNGSRTGGDTGYHGHATGVVIGNNYLNNVVWWCDPDAAAVLFDKPVDAARLNAQARALTGQQFLTDDFWSRVPPGIAKVWQRSFPMLDVKPANLYPIQAWKPYDHFQLRVAGPRGTTDVAGLFNFESRAATVSLDLGRLHLDAEVVHVFEYWSGQYLGRFERTAEIKRHLAPLEGQVFAVVPDAPARPVLLSTSRHVSQGGLDLESVSWKPTSGGWTVSGRSSHLVAGDPYEVVFAAGPYVAKDGSASRVDRIALENFGGLSRFSFLPERSGTETWQVRFERRQGPALCVTPAACSVDPDGPAALELFSIGDSAVTWTAKVSDPCVRIEPSGGRLGPWPAREKVLVAALVGGLEPDATWAEHVDFVEGGAGGAIRRVAVRVRVPPPPNLALDAEATASSRWGDDDAYRAARINDGLMDTRWNSASGDENGCWILLTWPEPVTFNRLKIRECTDYGLRIQAWRIEAGGDALARIAEGGEVGEEHTVILEAPVTARRLKLTVDRASVTPTIRELEVHHWTR